MSVSTTVTDFDGARVGEGSEEVLDDGSEAVRGGGGDVKGDEEDDQKDVTSVSTSSSASDEIKTSHVRAQFDKLAGVLAETNANLHTFEFMLNQYRQLAKIQPFNVTPGAGDAVIVEQLKQLSSAVERMTAVGSEENQKKIPERFEEDSSAAVNAELQALRKQVDSLKDASLRAESLSRRVQEVEASLEAKSDEVARLNIYNRRLQAEADEERRKRMALDAKLDSEQKAAKIVAQDITRYVESMKQLERQAESDKKTKLNQANQITSLQKQLKQESDEKKKLQHEMSLSSKITSDTLCETCLDRSTGDHLVNSTLGKGNVLESAKETASIVSALEDQVRVLTKEKLHLEQRLSYSSYPVAAITPSTTNFNESNLLCQTCVDKSTLEVVSDVARSTEQVHDSALRVSQELVSERRARQRIEAEHQGCQEQIGEYQRQCAQLKEGLETLKGELEQWQSISGATSPNVVNNGSKDYPGKSSESQSLLRKTQLKLASVKAQRTTLLVAEGKAFEELEATRTQLRESEESLERLKAKSKTLLERYRERKQLHTSAMSKLQKVRLWLVELSKMCQTKDDNNRKILDHLGNQIEISGKLLATFLNVNCDTLTSLNYRAGVNSSSKKGEGNNYLKMVGSNHSASQQQRMSLAAWFCDVQALSSWTHAQLTALGSRHWKGGEPALLKLCHQNSESGKDTLSELSHTLTHDEGGIIIESLLNAENVSSSNSVLKAVVEEQDSIAQTQKNRFDSLLSMIE